MDQETLREARDATQRLRRPPSDPVHIRATVDGRGEIGEDLASGPIELTVEVTDADGEPADWLDDLWWTSLIERWGDDALTVSRLEGDSLPSETLAVDIEFGLKQVPIPVFTRLAWVNRFSPTPNQLPLRIERLEAWFSRAQPITGRPIRILVYTDPAGTGDIANATLVFTQDTFIPAPGGGAPPFDFYPLSTPVEITGGDFYVGFYDLVADGLDAFGFYDQFVSGNAYTALDSTAPVQLMSPTVR